jgi:hypothetical protein
MNNGTKLKIGNKIIRIEELAEVAIFEKEMAVLVGDIISTIEKLYGDIERFRKEIAQYKR